MSLKYELLWQENFQKTLDGLPNPDRWNFDLGDGSAHGIPGWGNQEREFYVKENARVDSQLVIRAARVSENEAPDTYYGKAEWLSSKIHTAGKVGFLFGRFEFDVSLPSGGGSWPAIWMLGTNIAEAKWPFCGEIDIFEGAGNRPQEVRGTLHGPGYSADAGITGVVQHTVDLSFERHKVSIEWLPDVITWYFDGEPYFVVHANDVVLKGKAWPFNEPHYLIINLAMGGWFAGDIVPELNECQFTVHGIRHSSINGVGRVILYKE